MFGGMDPAEFKTKGAAIIDAREAREAAEHQAKDTQNRRTESDLVTQRLLQLVINSIK